MAKQYQSKQEKLEHLKLNLRRLTGEENLIQTKAIQRLREEIAALEEEIKNEK